MVEDGAGDGEALDARVVSAWCLTAISLGIVLAALSGLL